MQQATHTHRRKPCTQSHTLRPLLSALCTLSFLSLVAPLVSAQRLFISFYSHSATERIIEVYNPSCYTVNLADYALRIAPYTTQQAGAAWGAAIPLDSTPVLPRLLPANGRVSVCSLTVGLCTTPVNAALNFNGADAVGLFHNNVLIDIIGSTVEMTGESCSNCPNGGRTTQLTAPWFVAGVAGATQLGAIRRKPRVTEGSVDFFYPKGRWVGDVQASEWTIQPSSTAGLGTFTCTTCGVYCTVLHATCGTLGSDYPLSVGGATQVDCPLDCLARTARPLVDGGVGNVVGSGGRYAQSSPVCMAGIHAGILVLNTDAFPAASFVPQPSAADLAAICQYAAVSSAPAYSGSDPSLFPESTRMNGRPYMSYAPLASEAFTGSATRCITSDAGTDIGFRLSILNATVCDASNCGGPTRGYCHQSTGKCLCNSGYSGTFCASKSCTPSCVNGACTAAGTCACPGGFSGTLCQIRSCTCSNHGDCNAVDGSCSCHDPYFGPTCALKKCPANCHDRGYCNHATGTCSCFERYAGEQCELRLCEKDCSGFGTCDYTTGQCRCLGASPAGSDVPTSCLFAACPSSNALVCSGHGTCNYESRACACFDAWRGEDCSASKPTA